MNKGISLCMVLGVALSLLFCSTWVFGEQGQTSVTSKNSFVKLNDLNNDGQVTRDEYIEKFFYPNDKDMDGFISLQDIEGGAASLKNSFAKNDLNNDNLVTPQEYLGGFIKRDRDSNGIVTNDELRQEVTVTPDKTAAAVSSTPAEEVKKSQKQKASVSDQGTGSYSIQLAYFTDMHLAQRALSSLTQKGYHVELKPFLSAGVNLIAGSYKSKEDASRAMQELQTDFADAFIVE